MPGGSNYQRVLRICVVCEGVDAGCSSKYREGLEEVRCKTSEWTIFASHKNSLIVSKIDERVLEFTKSLVGNRE